MVLVLHGYLSPPFQLFIKLYYLLVIHLNVWTIKRTPLICQWVARGTSRFLFSTYTKLLRVVAWIKRFLHNSHLTVNLTESLSANELCKACKSIVKLIQQSEFCNNIATIENNKTLPKSSKLLSLKPFLYSEQILRVGGHLRKNRNLPYDSKHQILLPKHHPVITAII